MSEVNETVTEATEQGSVETTDTPSESQLELAQSIFVDPSATPEETQEETEVVDDTPETEPETEEPTEDPATAETPQEETEEQEDGYELFGRKYTSEEAAEQSLEEKGKYLNEKQSELDKLRNDLEQQKTDLEKRLDDLQRAGNLTSPEKVEEGRQFMEFYQNNPEKQKELVELLRAQGHPMVGVAGVYSDDPAIREVQTQLEHLKAENLRMTRNEAIQKFRHENSISEGQMDQIVSRTDEISHEIHGRTGVKVDVPFELARKVLQAEHIPTLIARIEKATEDRVRAEMQKGRKAKSVGAGGQVNKGMTDDVPASEKERLKRQKELAESIFR